MRPAGPIRAVVGAGTALALLAGCSAGEPDASPTPPAPTGQDLPSVPNPDPETEGEPTVMFTRTSDGCVEPGRDDWKAFMAATGLGDLDGDGEDDFVHHYADRRSRVRGVVELTGGGLAPILDQAADGTPPTGDPEPGPVLEVAGRMLLALDLGGTPTVRLGFAEVEGCTVDLLSVGGDPGGFPYATTGTDCLPECGVGLTCTGQGVEAVRWEVFVRGADGSPVPWDEVADDPSVRSDDLRVTLTTTRHALGSSGFSSSRPSTYTTAIDDGRLAEFHDGFVCGDLQLHPFAQELTGFGIDPAVFDQQRDELG